MDGPPHAQNALFEGDELIAVPTNFGLLTPDDDVWRWTPEELVRGLVKTSAAVDGRAFLGTTDGLHFTADRGCTWSGPEELAGATVLAIEVDGATVWVGTEASSRPSGMYVSTDSGESFEPTELFGPSIRVSGIRSRDDVVWAAGFDTSVPRWMLWTDTGGGFEAIDVGDVSRVRLFDLVGDDALLGLQTPEGWLLQRRAVDGSNVEQWPVDAEVVDAAIVDGRPLYVSDVAALIDASTSETLDTQVYCVDAAFRCRSVDGAVHAVEIGAGGQVPWEAIEPAECEGADADVQVDSLWPTANAAGFGARPETPADTAADETGCCAHIGANTPASWCFLTLLLMRRRRAAKMSATTTGARS